MRKLRRIIPALLIVLLLGIPAVAYASNLVKWTGVVGLSVVGPLQALDPGTLTPMDTETNFKLKYDKDGDLKNSSKVVVDTTNEFVTSMGSFQPTIALTSCEPAGSPICGAIDGSTLSSLHNSRATLKKLSVVPGPVIAGMLGNPLFGAFDELLVADQLKGDLGGKRGSTVSIVGDTPADFMVGELKVRVYENFEEPAASLPMAIYGCILDLDPFIPFPLPISSCEAGTGQMVPLFLSIIDKGTVTFGKDAPKGGDFADAGTVTANVEITILGDTGFVEIMNGKVK